MLVLHVLCYLHENKNTRFTEMTIALYRKGVHPHFHASPKQVDLAEEVIYTSPIATYLTRPIMKRYSHPGDESDLSACANCHIMCLDVKSLHKCCGKDLMFIWEREY